MLHLGYLVHECTCFICRETRRERILENKSKAIKAAERQAALIAKRRESEKKKDEERLLQNGCPIKKAEKAFFDSLENTRREREKMVINDEYLKVQ